MTAMREGYSVDFKREVAEFAEANPNWKNTEVGTKFNVPTEYVRRWRLALQDGKLDTPDSRGTKSRTVPGSKKASNGGSNGSNGGRKANAPGTSQEASQDRTGTFRVEGLEETFPTLNDAKRAAMEAVFEERITDINITEEVVEVRSVFSLVKPTE